MPLSDEDNTSPAWLGAGRVFQARIRDPQPLELLLRRECERLRQINLRLMCTALAE